MQSNVFFTILKGVLVELEDGSLFHVADKDFKASMKLEILRSDGLTGRMTGVLGQTIQPKVKTNF